jgi:surface antigen
LIAPGDRETADTRDVVRITFSFTLSENVRPGRQWVIARCAGVPEQRFPLMIRRPTAAGSSVRGPPRAVVPAPATPEQAAARAWWVGHSAEILANFRNGQCTDWAARKRTDIVERVMEAAFVAMQTGKPFPAIDFTAKNWATLAKLAGLTVASTPVAGAIVVWQPGVEGAAEGSGHVAYVESVTHTSFTTSEMNLGGPYMMGSRTLSKAPVAGRVFIYP